MRRSKYSKTQFEEEESYKLCWSFWTSYVDTLNESPPQYKTFKHGNHEIVKKIYIISKNKDIVTFHVILFDGGGTVSWGLHRDQIVS